MVTAPPRAIALFGTDEPVAPSKTLRAGPLTADFGMGMLRHVKVGGREAIRSLAFVLRGRDGRACQPALQNPKIGQGPNGFEIGFEAICRDGEQAFRYRAVIRGKADGGLGFEVEARALTDCLISAVGFEMLHPLDGIVGRPVTIERVDGSRERAVFPERIDPSGPFRELKALTHRLLPGIEITCRMEGGAFETEDLRGTGDAAFKTRPRPPESWPRRIEAGETMVQSVTLSLSGEVPAAVGGGGIKPVRLTVGRPVGVMPAIGLSLPPEQDRAILEALAPIQALAPQFLVCPFDSRIANGAPKGLAGPSVSTFPLDDPRLDGRGEVMAMFKALGEATGAALVLEAVLACRDQAGLPSADDGVMQRDLGLIKKATEDGGIRFDRVAVSPSVDLKSRPDGGPWPPAPDAQAIYRAARDAFPDVPLGGGVFSYFAELDRRRPPVEALDFICHTTCPIVHAADDVTVMENLEALPSIVQSVRALAGDLPYHIGPSTIGARDDPYGAVALSNPHNRRLARARMDPRQRGLFGAAWTLGHVAHLARSQVEAVALSAPVGEFGVVHAAMDYAQPWFDQQGSGVYPVYHVIRGLAAGAGLPMLATELADGRAIQAVAWREGGRTTLWIANLTGEPQEVVIEGLPGGDGQTAGSAQIARLDLDSFTTATAGPEGLEMGRGPIDLLDLGAYGVMRVVVG